MLVRTVKQNLEDFRFRSRLKEEKSGGVVAEEGECGDDVVGLLERDRRRLDILSVKKEAKLSAREIPGVKEGKGKEDLRCKSLFTVCQRHFGLPEDDETRLEQKRKDLKEDQSTAEWVRFQRLSYRGSEGS